MASQPIQEEPEVDVLSLEAPHLIFRMSAIFTDTGVSTRSMGDSLAEAEKVFDLIVNDDNVLVAYLFARTFDHRTVILRSFHHPESP